MQSMQALGKDFVSDYCDHHHCHHGVLQPVRGEIADELQRGSGRGGRVCDATNYSLLHPTDFIHLYNILLNICLHRNHRPL